MVHFTMNSIQGFLIVLGVLVTISQATETNDDNELELGGILGFLHKVFKPYIEKLGPGGALRNRKESKMEAFIRKKVEELKPYLQDDEAPKDDDNEDNDKQNEVKDDTAILEFIPNVKSQNKNLRNDISTENNTYKLNVKKYKKMRQTIEETLIKESVSYKSRKKVTELLDNIIDQIMSNQCMWKSAPTGQSDRYRRTEKTSEIAKQLNEKWTQMRRRLGDTVNNDRQSDIKTFFDQFHEFFNNVIHKSEDFNDRYKIVCQVVDRKGDTNNGDRIEMRKSSAHKNENDCNNFKVCTTELQTFLGDFYTGLNDTAVSTIRNYAFMYVRDVNTDGSKEKENIITTLTDISDLVERKVINVFKKETSKFQLDKKKQNDNNIKALNDYINTTVDNVNKHIRKVLITGLGAIRASLQSSIKKDLNVNLNVDLGNFENDLTDRICSTFVLCNSKGKHRRNLLNNDLRNSVYVKLQLNFDKDLKSNLNKIQNPRPYFRSIHTSTNEKETLEKDLDNIQDRRINNVTRTTTTRDVKIITKSVGIFNETTSSTLKNWIIVESFNETGQQNEILKI